MILKEAFRYQNKFDEFISEAVCYLDHTDNITSRTQRHKISKENKEAEDQIITLPKNTLFENESITPNDVILFLADICSEKEKLTDAISLAKKNSKFDMDAALSMNKTRQMISKLFFRMANTKTQKNTLTGRAFKFNVEGNQIPYCYEIEEVSTIDFDRKLVKSLSKQFNMQSDKISADVDMANITIEVNYTPKYNIDDSFEDCIMTLKNN